MSKITLNVPFKVMTSSLPRLLSVLLLAGFLSACQSEREGARLQGRLLTEAGDPVAIGNVGIRGYGHTDRMDVAEDGSFSFDLPQSGAWYLTARALHHQSVFRPVFVDDGVNTDITFQLAKVRLLPELTDVGVIGEFNDYDDDDGVLPMTRQPDGTWTGRFAAPADTFAYQLMGVQFDEYPLAGTQYDWFVPDTHYPTVASHAGKFVSVVQAPDDSVSIVFDPSLLPEGEEQLTVIHSDASTRAAQVDDLYASMESTRSAFQKEWTKVREAGGSFMEVEFDWTSPKEDMRRVLAAMEDSVLREYVVLSYLEKLRPDTSDLDMALRLFDEVDPGSPMWSFVWGGPTNMFYRSAFFVGEDRDTDAYALAVTNTNPDSMVQADLLFYLVGKRFGEMQEERDGLLSEEVHTGQATRDFSILFNRLITDYAETHYAQWATQQFAPSRAIQPGNPALPLTARALPDTSQTVSLSDLQGEVTLLEFWALWCGPCIGEMPNLHDAYEQFADQGFEIISISVDEDPRDVAAFRAEKWAMPWKHLWLKDGWDSDIMERYEVAGIPRPVLIDREGNILATGMDARGETLIETVAAALENRKAGSSH